MNPSFRRDEGKGRVDERPTPEPARSVEYTGTKAAFRPDLRDPVMRHRAHSWIDQRAEGVARVLARGWRATAGGRTRVIAVTGSFGKTTTTRAIAAALGQSANRKVFTNTYAALYLHLMRMTGRQSHCVLEVGIGQPNQMKRHAGTLRPDIAVVTSIGAEHAGAFDQGLEGIQREKGELVAALPPDGVAILNADDPRVMAMSSRTSARVVTFGRAEGADVQLVDFEGRMDGSILTIGVEGRLHAVEVKLVGHTSAACLLAAVAATRAAGLDLDRILSRLVELEPTSRRLQPFSLPNGARALLDDCKGTPPTAHAAFEFMAGLRSGRRVGVLGNIPRTGSDREESFRALGAHAGRVFDRIFLACLSDPEFAVYRESILETGFPEERLTRLLDVHEGARVLERELRPDDLVLFKAHFSDKISRTILLMRGVPVRCKLSYCLVRGSHWCDRCPAVFKELEDPV